MSSLVFLLVLALVSACRAKEPEPTIAKKATITRPTTRSIRDACDLLTKQEVEEVLETTVGNPVSKGSVCHFLPDGKPARGVSLTVRWTGGKTAMQGASFGERLIGSMGDKETQAAMKKAFGGDSKDLEGLGDEASFQMVMLHVRKGDAYFTVDARLCSRAQAIALARKAVARL